MVTNEKKAEIIQIIITGIFGICFEMDESTKEKHREFLVFHIKDFYDDMEKVLLTLNKDSRMFLEKILYEFKKAEVIKGDFNINDEEMRNGFNNTMRLLRNPKRAKYLVKYADENWQNFVDKDF